LGLAKVKTYKFRSVDNPGGSASEIWDFDHGTAGFFVRQLEASLALAEIEAKSGKKTEARALLQSVEKDARGKGCLLIARKAAIDRG
jgi:sarcosine oxidase delta subunit